MNTTTKPGVLAEMDRAATCAALTVPNTTIAADLREARATVERLAEVARRAKPFLQDEADKYEDDGSNEPLETLRDLDAALAAFRGEQS